MESAATIVTSVGDRTNARRLLLSCLLLSCLLPPTAFAQKIMHVLTSSYEGGWIQDGIMFDVQTVAVKETSPYHCRRLRNRHPNTPHMELFGLLLPHWSGTGSPTFIPLGAFDPIVMVVGETYAFMSRRGLHLNTTYSSFYMYYRGKYIGMTMPMKDRVAPFLIYLA